MTVQRTRNIILSMLEHSFFAVLADDHLTNLVERWVCERVPAGKCIYRPKSKSRYLYCVLEGAVRVKPMASNGQKATSSRKIESGHFVGFTESLDGTVRTAECRAAPTHKSTVICKLPAKLFRKFREISQSRRTESVKRFFRDLSLRTLGHPLQTLSDCQGFLQQRCFLDRNTIYEQHDEATHFYMVFHGRVVLTCAERPHCAIHLQTGHFFGHQELFGLWPGRTNCLIKARAGGRRSVTAVAAGRVICTMLPRQRFLDLFAKYPDVLNKVGSPATCQHCKPRVTGSNSLAKAAPVTLHVRRSSAGGTEIVHALANHGYHNEWSQPQASAGLAEDYVTVRKIGCGSFGNVFLARSRQAGTTHAIKIVSKLDLVWCNENVCFQVSEEMQLLRRLKHPLVVDVQQTFSDESNLYIAMEHCSGGSLYAFMRDHPPHGGRGTMLSDDQVKITAAFAIDVFSFLHSHRVVYRDSKSENIVIDALGRLRLIDFTLAKEILHKTYTICGTPQYMAPEIVVGSGYNESVDMWALGVMMYEFLSACNPFEDPIVDDVDEEGERLSIFRNVVERKVSFPIPRIGAFRGAREREINDFVTALLIKRPSARPSASAMWQSELIGDISVPRLREGAWPNADIKTNPFLLPMGVADARMADSVEIGAFITDANPDAEAYVRTGESFEDLWDEVFPPLRPRGAAVASTNPPPARSTLESPRYSWGDERKSSGHSRQVTATDLSPPCDAKADPTRLGPLKVASSGKTAGAVPSLLDFDLHPSRDADAGKVVLAHSPQDTLEQRPLLPSNPTPLAQSPLQLRPGKDLRPLWEQERKGLAEVAPRSVSSSSRKKTKLSST